jgi:hypothetical protein
MVQVERRRERGAALSDLADQGFLHKRSASDQHRTEERKNKNTPAPIVFLCNCCRWLARTSGGRVEEPCSNDPRGRGAISPSCGCSPVSACTRTESQVSRWPGKGGNRDNFKSPQTVLPCLVVWKSKPLPSHFTSSPTCGMDIYT